MSDFLPKTNLLPGDLVIQTAEMHAGGEKIRIIEAGFPELKGTTLLEKRKWLMESADQYRKFLLLEPRGQPSLTCALLVKPDSPEVSDVGVIFFDKDMYGAACGTAVLCVSRYAVEKKLVQPASPETRVVIQCPSGLVTTHVQYHNGRTGQSRFQNVPSYVFARDVSVNVPGLGEVMTDIAFGGGFYAIVPAHRLGISLTESSTDAILDIAQAVSIQIALSVQYSSVFRTLPFLESLRASVKLNHPDSNDLAFILGVIITSTDNDAKDTCNDPCVELGVFGKRQVVVRRPQALLTGLRDVTYKTGKWSERLAHGPCGSGTSALMALLYDNGVLGLGEKRQFRNAIVGTVFTGSVVRETRVDGAGPLGGSVSGVIAEVAGHAFFTGSTAFTVEANDPVAAGYLPYRDAVSA
ncbi:hypothetical protein BaRGS_00014468 [Batillaria attramentaria]|uniref:trans-L-3-hydroxyproline dehydratase n=1 Tax=Batillaria attramentaria TaxID=370345 RepID=A0ABD0L5D9_9CAEN